MLPKTPIPSPGYKEPLLTRKEIAAYLKISLVNPPRLDEQGTAAHQEGEPRPIPEVRSSGSYQRPAGETGLIERNCLVNEAY